jgi:hypothetical protein
MAYAYTLLLLLIMYQHDTILWPFSQLLFYTRRFGSGYSPVFRSVLFIRILTGLLFVFTLIFVASVDMGPGIF